MIFAIIIVYYFVFKPNFVAKLLNLLEILKFIIDFFRFLARKLVTLHKKGEFLSSGSADKVYEEAGLDGNSLLAALKNYAHDLAQAQEWL